MLEDVLDLFARRALEQKPRATDAENASYAKRLRSADQLGDAYNTMRHADFCDVVSAAVKSGNLSHHEAMLALYTREWVRCGAALQASFPEWFEAAGRQHILALNAKWLASGLRNTSFNEWLACEPLPPELMVGLHDEGASDPWERIARIYDRNDASQLNSHLTSIYEALYATRARPEDLAYYASFVCGVAVAIRETLTIDISTVMFIVEPPPLAEAHPLNKVLPVLDGTIETVLDLLAKSKKDDGRQADANAMMQASFIWKSYLLALNTYPETWGTDAVCALSALRILTTADAAQVRNSVRNEVHVMRGNFSAAIRAAVHDSDWPPRGFLDLYRKHGDILERKCRALFGTFY
jgi:hypothetical protein